MPPRASKPAKSTEQLAAVAFRKYAPELHRYIDRRMRGSGNAPDLTQEIFVRFLQVSNADAVRKFKCGGESSVVDWRNTVNS